MKDSEYVYSKLMKTVILLGDILICNTTFYVFYLWVGKHLGHFEVVFPLTQVLIVLTLCYIVCVYRGGVILHFRKVYYYQIVMCVLRNIFKFSIVLGGVFIIGNYIDVFSKFYFAYISIVFILICIYRISIRCILKLYREKRKQADYVVMVGSTINNVELYHEMTDDATSGFRVCGYFDDIPNNNFSESCCYLGKPEESIVFLERHPEVRHLFCCLPSRERDRIIPIIDYCENHLVHFYSVPNLHNYLHNRVFLNMLGDVPYLSLHRVALNRPENKLIKRLFDISFSLLFLCTLFPVIFIVVAIVTKITMPGPVFFRQKRSGLNNKDFYCLKFRSMKVNSQADILQATKDDPRKTRWGEILRKTNLDETPQFINVLVGDMSVVGPRPHMLKHTEEYSKQINKYMVRHFVKPGITGWSQVSGFRGETKYLRQMECRVKGDIWYIEHWNLALDLIIIYKTIINIIMGEKNAY
ncbi:undecaprenyl-phosphate glucose phosphotransferase [Bacteroides congonensis]